MPHIRAHGVDKSTLEQVAEQIVKKMAEVTDTPHDHFTFECIASDFLVLGGASQAYPLIEIVWFDRGQEVKTVVAGLIDDLLRSRIEDGLDITVIFKDLKGADYYENKAHF